MPLQVSVLATLKDVQVSLRTCRLAAAALLLYELEGGGWALAKVVRDGVQFQMDTGVQGRPEPCPLVLAQEDKEEEREDGEVTVEEG